jgi:hypothetical protein
MWKRVSLSIAAALLVSAAAFGQQERLASSTPEQRAKLQTEFMTKRLGLGATQIPKIEAINLKYAKKMEPILKGGEGPLVKLRASKAIEEDKGSELEKVLSKEQYQQYLASREEMRQKIEERLLEKHEGGGN